MIRRAACSCGALSIRCDADPVRVSICHCFACQQRTGSVFGVQARFRRDDVTVTGPSTAFVRVGDSGGRSTSYFCPTCGSTVYYELGGLPEFLGVPVGGFADPAFPAPTRSVYEARRHGWVGVPVHVEHED